MVQSALLLSIRMAALLGRFGILLYAAHRLPVRAFGEYGIFAAVVALVAFAVPLGLHAHTYRDLASAQLGSRAPIVARQITAILIQSAVLLPMSLVLFMLEVLDPAYILLYLGIVIGEIVAMESYRALIALRAPLVATALQAFRMSGAVGIYIAVAETRIIEFTLLGFLCSWLVGNAIANLVSVISLSGAIPKITWEDFRSFNLSWYWKILRKSSILLASLLITRGMLTVDRIAVEAFASEIDLAAYVLFAAIYSAVLSLLDSGAVIRVQPALITAATSGDQESVLRLYGSLFRSVLKLTGVAAIGLFIARSPVLSVIQDGVFLEHIGLYSMWVAIVVVVALGLPSHQLLYAFRDDVAILGSQLLGGLAFIACIVVTSVLQLGAIGVASGVFLGFGVSAVCKWNQAKRRLGVSGLRAHINN